MRRHALALVLCLLATSLVTAQSRTVFSGVPSIK